MAASQRTGGVGRDEADERDRAADRDAGSYGDGAQRDDLDRQTARLVSNGSGYVVTQRHHVERLAPASEQGAGDSRGDQRGRGLGKAAVDEAAHQPFEAVVESERRGGERK